MNRPWRITLNARASKRAVCRREDERPQKAAPLIPLPVPPDLYAFGEEIAAKLKPVLYTSRPPQPGDELAPPARSSASPMAGSQPPERPGEDDEWTAGVRLSVEWPNQWPYLPRIVRKEIERPHHPLPQPVYPNESDSTLSVGMARAIGELCAERYLDPALLAGDAGLPRWQLTALEEGRLLPLPFALISKLASALGLKLSELIERAEELDEEVAR